MDGEYRDLYSQSTESNILFYGQENCSPNFYFKGNNIRKNYVIHYIQNGQGSFQSAGHHVVKLQKGDLFILPKGIPCFYQADGKHPWSYFWIGISGTKIANILANSSLSNKNYLRQVKGSQFSTSLHQLFKAIHAKANLANTLKAESLLYQTFYYLVTEYPAKKQRKNNFYREEINIAIQYFEKNYDDPNCNITELCHHLDLSRSYIYTLFKKNTDSSPQKFLTRLRMEKAKSLLKNSDETMQYISQNIGYNDEFTFSKSFKRYVGLSPKIYREEQKNRDSL